MSKKKSVRVALVLSFAQRYTSLPFNILTVIVVSRLLTPQEIGVFSVAAGLAALANMLRVFGVSDFLVQERSLNDDVIRTSFTVNLIFAWTLAVIVFLASWQVGVFYGDSGVGRVMRVLSLTFLLVPFGVTAMALLKRDLAFGVLYKINTGQVLVRCAVTLSLVFLGFSYMSMAWASVGEMSALIIGCGIWGRGYNVRGLSLSQWRRVVPFGAKQTVVDLAVQLGQQSANVVVGRMLGLAAAGFYSRGYSVVNLFRGKVIGAIGAVAYPAFAAEHRQSNTASALFLRSLVYLTGISWPFFAFCAFMAFPIIRIPFGDQWGPAIPLMRWLCVAAIVATLIYQGNQFLTAIGRVGAAAVIEVQYQLARVALAIVAAFYSLEAVAASQVLVYVLATGLYYRKMRDFDTLTIGRCARALVPSAAVTVTASIVPAIVLFWPHLLSRHLVPAFVLAAAGAAAGWVAGVVFVKHPLLAEVRMAAARLRGYLDGRRQRHAH